MEIRSRRPFRRYPSLNVVRLRVFERMSPLTALDVSDNNIRDEGLAFLVEVPLRKCMVVRDHNSVQCDHQTFCCVMASSIDTLFLQSSR